MNPQSRVTELTGRNALRLAREAEETARGTIGRLADQSGEPFPASYVDYADVRQSESPIRNDI
jgi:hypothetical protein